MFRIPHPPHYPDQVLELTRLIAEENGADSWKSRRKTIKIFKAVLLGEGLQLQNGRCAWCTLKIDSAGRRSPHQDHIAPKSLYGKWTFHPLNLVLTCEWCNTKEKKALDTVAHADDEYELSTFFLVHPYLEQDIDQHIAFDDGLDFGILIIARSDKGAWTIEKLGLDTPEMTLLRAQDALLEEKLKQLGDADVELAKEAVEALGA